VRRLILLASALGLLLYASPAFGATIKVNTTSDTLGAGVCSLREAIDSSNASGPTGSCALGTAANRIEVPAGHYTLSQGGATAGSENLNAKGDLDVNAPVTIAGAGATATTVDGGQIDRVFGVNGTAGTVQIQDLGIAGGHAPDGVTAGAVVGTPGSDPTGGPGSSGATFGRGGGVSVAASATLTLLRCRVFANHAGNGGTGGSATGVTGSPTLSGHSATGGNGAPGANGGGVLNASGATLSVVDSVFLANFAGDGGSGGRALGTEGDAGGNATGGNGSTGGSGGAIDNDGTLTVTGTTFTANDAGPAGVGGAANAGPGEGSGPGGEGTGGGGGVGGAGGAIHSTTDVTIESSTFDHNDAGEGGSGGSGQGGAGGPSGGMAGPSVGGDAVANDAGNGGGLSATGGSIDNSTLSANSAGAGGNGGVPGGTGRNGGNGGAIVATSLLVNFSTVAGNSAGNGGSGSGSPLAGVGSGLDAGASSTLQDSVVAANPCAGGLAGDTGSITAPGSGCTGTTQANANLGSIQDNGGPTETMALVAPSPAIDHVAASAIFPAEDQRGAVRPGGTGADAGAYEVDPPIAKTGAGASIATATAALTSTLDARGLDTAYHFQYGRSTALGQSTPTGRSASRAAAPVSAELSRLAAGTTYFYRVVATGPDGTSTGAIRSFTTKKPAVPPPGGGSSPRDRTAPKLAKLRVTPKRFRAGAKAKILFRLSENAAVVLDVQKKGVGVKVKRKKGTARCVTASAKNKRTLLAQIKKKLGRKKTKGKAGHKRIVAAQKHARCTIYHSRGKLKKAGKAGANSVALPGKLAKKALAAGTYRIVAGATDPARNKAKPATAPFSVAKKKTKKR
jgi:CSLREA domain-containing protein